MSTISPPTLTDTAWLNPKAMLASRYSGLISRDAVLRATGRMLALDVDRWRFGDEGNERSRGGLGRKSSKLLERIVRAKGA
jgi:hypothetical protein